MGVLLKIVIFVCCFNAVFCEEDCILELDCPECIPDAPPLLRAGSSRARHGDEVALWCAGTKFIAYPLRDTITARCEHGRYRVLHDNSLRHVLDLGCQENIFEDVLHQVQYCDPPYQGRAYQRVETGGRKRHLALACFDQDRGLTLRLTSGGYNEPTLAKHDHSTSPLTLLGNFNHMFDSNTRHDAEKLYSNPLHMNKRLHQLFKHENFSFAGQTLTSAKLLSDHYFDDQNMRVTDFVSNKFAAWTSVVEGNLKHLQQDVGNLLKLRHKHLDVHVGTHGVLKLRTEHNLKEVYLKSTRFPVPQYFWTVVYDKESQKALAIVVLNDPFVSVSEIRSRVFCESACGSVSWAHNLNQNRNYETPVYGLTFCCPVHDFAEHVSEMPKDVFKFVPHGSSGMLLDVQNYTNN